MTPTVVQNSRSRQLALGVQGIGGATTSAVILGMIITMFPEPLERGKAIGVYSFVASCGASIGLIAGGILTQAINWHWIFFVNLPIGIAAALLAVRLLEPERDLGLGEGADVAAAVLVTSSLMLGMYAIVGVTDHGWASIQTGGFGILAIALLAGFIARQATAQNPLLPLRVFRSRNLSGANAVQALMIAGMLGMLFIGALYMQRILGYQPLEIGLAFLPAAVGIATLSLRFAPRLNIRFGGRAMLLTGLTIMTAGLAWLIRVPVDGTYVVDLLPSMILLGVGAGLEGRPKSFERYHSRPSRPVKRSEFGRCTDRAANFSAELLSFPSLNTLAMADVAPSDSGLASGLVNTTGQ